MEKLIVSDGELQCVPQIFAEEITECAMGKSGNDEAGTVTEKNNGKVYDSVADSSVPTMTDRAVVAITKPLTDIKNRGFSQVIAWDQNRGAVGMIHNNGKFPAEWGGIWQWSGSDINLWRVVGAGHFKGTKVDYDGVLLYNGIGNTFAAWTDLNDPSYGYVDLCHVEDSFNTCAVADFDGNEYDDILIYDNNGSFGVVLDGTTYKDIWHVDNPASNPWKILGAGSFGGKEDKAESLHYKYPHDYGGYVKQQYLPDSLKDKVYYTPSGNGFEQEVTRIRKKKGMTQEELGEIVGVQKSAVAKWENGRVSEIKRSTLKKLADALGISPVQLLGDVESDPVGTAAELANIYLDTELRKMISEYYNLDPQKQAQVREYVHLLSLKK